MGKRIGGMRNRAARTRKRKNDLKLFLLSYSRIRLVVLLFSLLFLFLLVFAFVFDFILFQSLLLCRHHCATCFFPFISFFTVAEEQKKKPKLNNSKNGYPKYDFICLYIYTIRCLSLSIHKQSHKMERK